MYCIEPKHALVAFIVPFIIVIVFLSTTVAAQAPASGNTSRTNAAGITGASTSTNVSSKDIDERSDLDLSDTLNMVPGMQASLHIGGSTEFSMRGYGQDKVAVLVDGIPINDAYESKADISQIPVANISHLIVNRGVSSALYGTCGTIGSINIITKRPTKLFTEFNGTVGQNDHYSLSAAHGAPIGNFYYWITASVQHSGEYRVSGKLDSDTRRRWLEKALRYDLYGKTYSDIQLQAVSAYINNTGTWDHFEFTKYQIAGKAGYALSSNSEAGCSISYYNSEKKSSNYDINNYSNYDSGTRTWSDPSSNAYTSDGKDAIFQNQARYFPEDYSIKVMPYYSYRGSTLQLKASAFLLRESDTLQAYADTEHTTFMNPSSVYSWDAGSGKAKPYFNNPFNSIFTDTSFGIQVLPSIRFSKHHRLNTSFMFSVNSHNEEEQALGNAPDIIAVHGSGVYKTKYLEVQTLTLAVEDEIEPLENLFLSLGISYDAQNLTDHRRRSTQQDTLNEYIEGYQAQDESTIWGTRDSFNPVIGLLYQAIPDFLIFRAAGSIKTTFPTLKAYSRISDTRGDLGIDPERSYNGNIGFELRLFSNAFSWRTDYFYSRFRDKIVKAFNEDLGGLYSVNIDGARTQGIESILAAESGRIIHIFSLSLSLSYTYLYNENLDNSEDERLNMGDGFAESPRHLLTFDIRAKFTTGTSLSVFGTYTRNQFLYVMSERPQTSIAEPYSTDYFEKLRLHDPLFINIRISQQIFGSASIYLLCKNVLDEYRPNPFNPGPGRTWYFGGKIVL